MLAVMAMLTSACSSSHVEPVLNGGYLNLRKGQTYRAPKDCTLVDLETVQQKDRIIMDLIRAQNKQSVKEALD